MGVQPLVEAAPQRQPLGLVAMWVLVAFAYTVLLGGTDRGEVDGFLHLISAFLASLFVGLYVIRAPTQSDRVDRGILLGLLFFLGSAVLSQFPRQSFDAALGALTATAALFVLRGELAHPEVRNAFIGLLSGLAVVLTLATAAVWLPTTLEWWSLTGWSVTPPLDLNFSAGPWGHRHDLTLLVVLLYPSLLIGRGSPLRIALAAVVGMLVLLIVIVDGSRNLWLAVLAATAAVLLPVASRHLPRSQRARRTMLVGVLVAVAIVVVSGLAAAVADRVLNLQSLGARAAMWIPLLDAWTERPLAGYGPGSFAWVLQLTDFYATSSWAPRHPDSAFFQLLAEGGLLGLVAMALVIATLLVPVLRGRSAAARWALITFVLASLAANPTDFAFLVAVAVGWTAYAVPREIDTTQPEQGSHRLLRVGIVASLLVISVAFLATTSAGLFYEDARRAVREENPERARQSLGAAMALDPGMALYPRQRGTLDYLSGAPGAGIRDLEFATRLNPSDDLAWRTLSLAYWSVGDRAAAEVALGRALAAQRSDPANLLLLARQQGQGGHSAGALKTLAEIVQSWPAIVAAPGWESVLPEPLSTSDVVEEAIRRWESDRPSPEGFAGQALWLVVLGGRTDLLEEAVAASGVSEALARTAIDVFQCSPRADMKLGQLSDRDRRTHLYWQLRIRQSSRAGEVDEAARTLLQIMRGQPVVPGVAVHELSPIVETGFTTDIWGYRRRQILWRADRDELPSPAAGDTRWMFDPRGAMRAADVAERLPHCD